MVIFAGPGVMAYSFRSTSRSEGCGFEHQLGYTKDLKMVPDAKRPAFKESTRITSGLTLYCSFHCIHQTRRVTKGSRNADCAALCAIRREKKKNEKLRIHPFFFDDHFQ